MRQLYSIGIYALYFGIKIVSYFNSKAKLWIEGRNNIKNILDNHINSKQKIIWFHCASLGEYEQGLPLINATKSKFPDNKILITFFSPSGYDVISKKNTGDIITYLPLDTIKQVTSFIEKVKPEKVFFIKYEFWYNLLFVLHKRHIPFYFISAVFRENQFFFKFYGNWFKKHLLYATHIFVQDEKSKKLLLNYGIKKVALSGDTRFDRVKEIIKQNNKLPWLATFKGNSTLIVAGSTWKEDDEFLITFINENKVKNIKFVIVPHTIHSKQIENLKNKLNKDILLYSKIQKGEIENIQSYQVLIVDTIGYLTQIYSYANIVFVGGGFGKDGVHNVLEPAVFGIPILIGPKYDKYIEVEELVAHSSVLVVYNYKQFKDQLIKLLSNSILASEIGEVSKNIIFSKPNAVNTIINFVFK